MLKLQEVTIHKYKCIESDQVFVVDEDVTVLVGMNESGKTSVLQALAKTNYFDDDDDDFTFKATHDYPRREKKKMEKQGVSPNAVTCKFHLSDELAAKINTDLGENVFSAKEFNRTKRYNNKTTVSGVTANLKEFVKNKTLELGISSKTLNEKLEKVTSIAELDALIGTYSDPEKTAGLEKLKPYYENKWNWAGDPISEFICRKFLNPNLPKFIYYDEYYALPSRISIEKLQGETLASEELKTAKALFDLADIDIDELINADDFEDFKAELEATESTITDELFEFWSTNKNLDIQFAIDKKTQAYPNGSVTIVEHILDIRVRNNRTKVSLPLKNRSKGFNWFFSFLVWFKKIQEDKDSSYIILLDEPGLNLHASAQADLLAFIENLSNQYQIIYTTHSPFMVDPSCLNRVRTVVETEAGSVVSDSIQEKDPNTLFPLQAALGYDIAQNLFISQNNLLVEGVSDLSYLQVMSGLLEGLGRTSLRDDITIVPVGGMEKVSTFVSLLRGSKLNIACLLDSSLDGGSKQKLNNLIREKIIHKKNIIFYDEFKAGAKEADVEDMFEKGEYLSLFNEAFNEHLDISEGDLNAKIDRIILQINKHLNVERFNHFRPANQLAKTGVDEHTVSADTLNRFEGIFEKMNTLF